MQPKNSHDHRPPLTNWNQFYTVIKLFMQNTCMYIFYHISRAMLSVKCKIDFKMFYSQFLH